jgi:hypothetical protein
MSMNIPGMLASAVSLQAAMRRLDPDQPALTAASIIKLAEVVVILCQRIELLQAAPVNPQ